MANPLLANLDGVFGADLKNRFYEARSAAVAAGATIEADAATRALQTALRNGIRAMVRGIDARAAAPAPAAAAPGPAPRPRSPMKPAAPLRPPIPAPAARVAAPGPKPPAPVQPPPLPVGPPALDQGDDAIPW